jgi:hypothetical protein
MSETVFVGDTLRVQFQLRDGKGQPVPIPAGTKLWAGVKRRPSDMDPPLLLVRNAAAGGSDSQIAIDNAAEGRFSAYFTPVQTGTLTAEATYRADGRGQFADGSQFTAGVADFTMKWPVTRTLA